MAVGKSCASQGFRKDMISIRSLDFLAETPVLRTNACAVAQAHDHKASESRVASLNGWSDSVKLIHGPSQVCAD